MKQAAATSRTRRFEGIGRRARGPVTLDLSVRMEGGHYTFVEALTSARARAGSTAA